MNELEFIQLFNQLTEEEQAFISALIEEHLSDPKYKPCPLHQAG